MYRKSIGLLIGVLLYFTTVCFGQSVTPIVMKIAPGGAVTLQFDNVNNEPIVGYQWLKDNLPIPGATNAKYTATEAGTYTLRTSNGTCTSDASNPIIVELLKGTADVFVVKSSEKRSITVNEIFDYSLRVKNNGPDAANKIIITDILPKELRFEQFVSPLIGIAKYDAATKTITWEISKMAVGETADLVFKVRATTGGIIKNSATITSGETDPKPGNNISIDLKPIIEIKVPNVFTPNNDGKNDYFKIAGLEFFTTNEITIMNRWGSSVYEKKNYQNDWSANGLSDGTYFYVLRVRNAEEDWQEFKGYVTVMR